MKLASVALLALLLPLVAAPALAGPLVVVPFTNGRFDLALRGWTAGPGVGVGDADFTGENEAILVGSSDEARLSAGLAHLPSPASTPLTFVVEGGVGEGVSFRAALADARDPGALAASGAPPTLAWESDSLPLGLRVFDPVDADFPAHPGWSDLPREARAEALLAYTYVGVSLHVAHASGPRGLLIDSFGFGVGEWNGMP